MTTWHWLTCEYPPQPGGVSDYGQLVATALAQEGETVQVWCPPSAGATPHVEGVEVQRICGRFGLGDLVRLGRALNRFGWPRRLLVQWVPQGYGWRSLNVGFCLWLWWRALARRDRIFVMVHEPFVACDEGGIRIKLVAAIQRLMTMVLLRAADHVGVSIPAWETCWRPYCLGRRVPFTWLPIPSTLPVLEDRDGVSQLRERLTRSGAAVVGHFGTYGRYVADLLRPVLVAVLKREPGCVVLLLGRESDVFRDRLAAAHPEFATRLHATGALESAGISRHLQACDVLVQPYPDGVSSRRTTAMAALAHGLPLVTNQGRLTEVIWAESQAAALTPAGEADTLAAAVCTLLSDPARRQALGRAGKTLYEQRFAPRHTLAALRRLAGEVVT